MHLVIEIAKIIITSYYHLVTPPSTITSCPVMYELASLARKTHAPMISSGSAMRPFIAADFHSSIKWGNYHVPIR